MDIKSVLKEDDFLLKYPLFELIPRTLFSDKDIIRQYQGYVDCEVSFPAYKNERISIEEELAILIPSAYPTILPAVFLLKSGKPVNYGVKYHFYNTGELCLGNNWEVRKVLIEDPSLINLLESLVIPHLAGTKLAKENLENRRYPQGEYSHGTLGRMEGLSSFFNIPQDSDSCLRVLKFLLLSKNVANKSICPFGCGTLYGECQCKGKFKEIKRLFTNKELAQMIKEISLLAMAATMKNRK